MSDLSFMITTDTCCDLPKSYIEDNGLDTVTLYYNMKGVVYGKEIELEVKEFYDMMRGWLSIKLYSFAKKARLLKRRQPGLKKISCISAISLR